MKMKKELLKKKKMLFAYVLVTSLSISAFSGCGTNYFEYIVEEDGNVVVEGTITFDKFKKLKLIHLTNEIAEIDRYILVEEKQYIQRHITTNYYVDMENGKIVYNNNDDDFKNFKLEIVVERMVDYLYKYDMVKDYYNIDDILKLKEYLLLDETLNIGNGNVYKKNSEEEVRVLKKSKRYC